MEDDKDVSSQQAEAAERLVGLVNEGASIVEAPEVMVALRSQYVNEETGKNGATRIEYSDGSAVIRNRRGIALGVHRDRIHEAVNHMKSYPTGSPNADVRFWKVGNYPTKLKFAYPHAQNP